MTLAERISPRVELILGGNPWRLLFTHAVLLDIEELTGKSVLHGEVEIWRPSALVLRAVLWALLRRAGAEYSREELGGLLGPRRTFEAIRLIHRAWEISMPAAEPDNTPSRKKPPAKDWMEVWEDNRAHLDITDSEWLDMTPRMVQGLSNQRLELTRHRELILSRLGAVFINFGPHPPKEPVPDDVLMLHPWKKKKQTGDDILEMFLPYTDARGKEVIHEVLGSEN